MDLALIPIETVEQLRRYTPSEQEVKVYKQYEKDKKPLDKLTDEDKLIYKVCSSITWSGFSRLSRVTLEGCRDACYSSK